MEVEVAIEGLDLRQDMSKLMALQSAECSNVEDGQAVVGDA